MDVLELGLPVPGQLRDDLHQPVRAALGEGRDEHVLPAGGIVLERILLLQAAQLPLAERFEHTVGSPQLLEGPTPGVHDPIHKDAQQTSNHKGRRLPPVR
ncbi:MAG TPA: hypothetical protein VN841_05480 [Bryobacteraceae bacterium]|nr:hypothetical protein [Bryobacteraceae bacterium]